MQVVQPFKYRRWVYALDPNPPLTWRATNLRQRKISRPLGAVIYKLRPSCIWTSPSAQSKALRAAQSSAEGFRWQKGGPNAVQQPPTVRDQGSGSVCDKKGLGIALQGRGWKKEEITMRSHQFSEAEINTKVQGGLEWEKITPETHPSTPPHFSKHLEPSHGPGLAPCGKRGARKEDSRNSRKDSASNGEGPCNGSYQLAQVVKLRLTNTSVQFPYGQGIKSRTTLLGHAFENVSIFLFWCARNPDKKYMNDQIGLYYCLYYMTKVMLGSARTTIRPPRPTTNNQIRRPTSSYLEGGRLHVLR